MKTTKLDTNTILNNILSSSYFKRKKIEARDKKDK